MNPVRAVAEKNIKNAVGENNLRMKVISKKDKKTFGHIIEIGLALQNL
jgi:hypothetical protein